MPQWAHAPLRVLPYLLVRSLPATFLSLASSFFPNHPATSSTHASRTSLAHAHRPASRMATQAFGGHHNPAMSFPNPTVGVHGSSMQAAASMRACWPTRAATGIGGARDGSLEVDGLVVDGERRRRRCFCNFISIGFFYNVMCVAKVYSVTIPCCKKVKMKKKNSATHVCCTSSFCNNIHVAEK